MKGRQRPRHQGLRQRPPPPQPRNRHVWLELPRFPMTRALLQPEDVLVARGKRRRRGWASCGASGRTQRQTPLASRTRRRQTTASRTRRRPRCLLWRRDQRACPRGPGAQRDAGRGWETRGQRQRTLLLTVWQATCIGCPHRLPCLPRPLGVREVCDTAENSAPRKLQSFYRAASKPAHRLPRGRRPEPQCPGQKTSLPSVSEEAPVSTLPAARTSIEGREQNSQGLLLRSRADWGLPETLSPAVGHSPPFPREPTRSCPGVYGLPRNLQHHIRTALPGPAGELGLV